MNILPRQVLAIGFALLVVLGFAYANSSRVAALGESGLPSADDDIDEAYERARRERLERADTQVMRRLMARAKVIDEVFADRLTLLEAAAWFGFIHDEAEDPPMADFRRLYPGRSDAEKLCRQVLRHVEREAQAGNSLQRAVHQRLAVEFQARLECNAFEGS